MSLVVTYYIYVHLSITHDGAYAAAVAIAEKTGNQ